MVWNVCASAHYSSGDSLPPEEDSNHYLSCSLVAPTSSSLIPTASLTIILATRIVQSKEADELLVNKWDGAIFEGVSKVRNPRSQQDSCALQLGLILDITNNTASVPDLVPAILDKAESWKDLNNFDEQDPEKPLRVLKRTGTYDFTGWLELSSARRLLFEQLRTHITFYVSNPAEGFNSKGLAELNSDVVRNVADELMQSPGGVLSLYAITQVWTEWKTLLLPHMHRWLSSLHRNTSAAFADLLLQGEGRQKYSAQLSREEINLIIICHSRGLKTIDQVWATKNTAARLLEGLQQHPSVRYCLLGEGPRENSDDGLYYFNAAEVCSLFNAWPRLVSLEIDGVFKSSPTISPAVHHRQGLETFSLTRAMVTVEDISSLVQPSATHLMTLILEHLEGLEGRALAQLISSLLNLRHLVVHITRFTDEPMASPTVSLNSWNQRSLEGKFEYQADFARQVAHLPLYDMSLSGVWASPLTLALPPPTLSRLVLHGSDYLEGTSLIEAASRLPPSSITSLDVRTLIGDWESANQLQRFKAICRSKGVDYLNVE